MAKRELTEEQKIIKQYIPNFFQWHEKCQKQVEKMVKSINKNDS